MGGRGSSSGRGVKGGGSAGRGAKGGGTGGFSQNATKIMRVLQGNRGMMALDSDGEPIYATNKTSANGALQLNQGRWKMASELVFTTGRRDASGTVSPSGRYSEAFATSTASKMSVVYDNITYSINKNPNFRGDAFKKATAEIHAAAQKQLKRRSDIIKKARASGKMSNDVAREQIRNINKEYANQINSFYKDKKNQKWYGFSVSHT